MGHVSHGILNKLGHSKNGLGLNLWTITDITQTQLYHSVTCWAWGSWLLKFRSLTYFYYPAHNFIDVSVPSFDYAIPRFFFGYLAAAIFCKNNRDYLLSVLLKVGAPLCLIPKRVHVSNCSNRAKKMQAGCQKYLVPWPFFRSTWKCGETPISSFSTLC